MKEKQTKKKASEQKLKKKPTEKPAKKKAPAGEGGAQKAKEVHGGELITINIKFLGDKNGGHHHVIVDDIDDKHVSVGFTTDKKKGKNSTNYKLEVSPLLDGKQSYMRRQGTVERKKEYSSPKKGVMTPKDYGKAKEYSEKAKKKYQDKKGKKK